MPVSGLEETEVKTCAGQFSSLIAGVPIKKRRFPLIHSLSSVSGEQCSLTEEIESLQKEHSNAPLGSNPALSNAGIADAPIKKRRFPLIQSSSSSLEESSSLPEENNASHTEDSSISLASTIPATSAGICVANENPAFEERKTSSDLKNASFVQSKSSSLRPKLEEPDLATQSSTLDVVDRKEKSIASESCEEKLGKKNSELWLAAKQSLALNIGAEISKQNVQEKFKQESHALLESTNLSLGLKQQLFPDVASLDVDNSFQKTEKSESFSLKLSLSKEDVSSKSNNGYAKANRENWDLNTTMDAWKEPGKDATTSETSIHGLQITDSALMDKHVMCSTGMRPTESTSLKQTSVESQKEAFTILSRMYGQQDKYVDPHNLYLAPCLPMYTGESSRSVKQNSDCVIPTLNSSNVQASSGDVNVASIRTIKSELLDENEKHDLKEAKPRPVGSLHGVSVKNESVEHSNVDSVRSSEGSNMKFHNPKLIKSEPGHKNNQETPKTTESMSDQISKEFLQGLDNCACLDKPVTMESVPTSTGTAPPAKAISSTKLSTSVGIVSHLENHALIEGACVDKRASQVDCSGDKQISTETVSIAMVDNTKSSGLGKKDSVTNEQNTDDAEGCRLKLKNEVPSDPHGRGEYGASDDDKITLSTDILEYDSYGYDYESDDMDIEQCDEEDDDYEDGEVREPVMNSVAEDSICEAKEVGGAVSSNNDNKQIDKEVFRVACPTSSHLEENDNRNVNHDEISCVNDDIDTESIDYSDNISDKTMCLQETLEAEKPIVGSQMRLDLFESQKVLNDTQTELSSDQGNNERNAVDAAHCADEIVKNLDIVRKSDSEMPMMEVSVNTDDANEDPNNGGNQGRIINLSRAACSLSPTKPRSIPSRELQSQAGRDILPEKFHHDKLHGQRDDFYIDGPRRFSRERYQDISPTSSRQNFVHGRGRINSRIDTRGGEWDSDRQFSGEFYNGPRQFRGSWRKFASSVHDADPEYDVTHDGSFVGTNRLGRKPLNNEGPVGCHIMLRRGSPGGRDNMQMGHRIQRAMSPSRCVGDDGSDFVSMRHGEKFIRDYPQEPLDPMFTHAPPFERVDGRFRQGGRNFIQRRDPQRIRSKSPIRSRSCSPGLWSCPQRRSPRRSPDRFVGHPELAHRRPLYRDDRMRSPDRPVFHGERVIRRHVSLSYMSRPSNEMRDFGSQRARGRGRGRHRSFTANRSPSGRIMFRKRFDAADPQGRADHDDYFEGPMHSGRLLELNGEGNCDERRRFNDRRGPVRSFRPPYNGENFHIDAEDGPRPYRYCTEDSEFQERSRLRERHFDRRIKSRPGNMPPRRTRNIDEQEANYRDSGQVWSDDGFDDISRMKRERF